MSQGKLFIVSAPSGAGKTTLVNALLDRIKDSHQLVRGITYTSRSIRVGEVQGVDYYFISHAEFVTMITKGDFLEWSQAYGHYYGTPKAVLNNLAGGDSCVLIVDREGAEQIVARHTGAVLIWIYVSSIEELRTRLIKRGVNSPEEMTRRLALALHEIEQENVKSLYDFHILNEDFSHALSKLEEIFIKSMGLDAIDDKR